MWLMFTGSAAAAVLAVGPGQPYATVGAAASAAASGDTIEVHAGLYVEAVVFPVFVHLVGVGAPVIRAPRLGTALSFPAGGTLSDLTVESVWDSSSNVYCAAYPNGADLTLTRVTLRGGMRGIQATSVDLLVEDSLFQDTGYGVDAHYGTVVVRNSTFEDHAWGAVSVWESTSAVVSGSTFLRNATGFAVTTTNGDYRAIGNTFCGSTTGAIWGDQRYSPAGRFVIAGNVFDDNDSTRGAGVALDGAHQALLEQNTFLDGAATASGGHVWVNGGRATLRGNVFAHATGTAVVKTPSALNVTGDWNLFWQNDVDTSRVPRAALGGSLYGVDPLFTSYSPDGDCTNDDLTPLPGSPLLDAGNPARTDPDGSPADIGAPLHQL